MLPAARAEGSLMERLNGSQHETALRLFMVIVLAHWGEHLLQGFQIYGLGWPVPEARGLIGYFFPVGDSVRNAALRLRARDARRAVDACAAASPAYWIAGFGPSLWRSSSSITSSTCCSSSSQRQVTTWVEDRCRPASRRCGCRASSCICSTTRSSSSRWSSRCTTTCFRQGLTPGLRSARATGSTG